MSAIQKWIAVIVTGVMILTLGIVLALAPTSSDAGTTPTTTATATTTPISDAEVEDQLTVSADELSLATLPEGVLCTNDMFVPNSLTGVEPGNPAMLQFSTAVSTPVQATEPLAARAEVFAERCGNPTLLDMDVKALATLVIQGKTLGERNPWMRDFGLLANTLGLRQAFLVQKDGQEGLFVTAAYSQYASMMNLLLYYWVPRVEALPSLENWHVVDRPFGELPRAELNPVQESQLALTLAYTAKEGCPLAKIGHNMLDKRFERFETCPTPPPGAPVTTEVPGTTPGTNPPTVTTLPPGTTVPPPATTLPPGTTVPPTPTVPPTVPPTTTVPKTCGDKNRPTPGGGCEPNLPPGGTVPAPPTIPQPPTTPPRPPTPPSTAPRDTLPPGITPTTLNPNPPVVTFVPPGATQTTTPPATVAPPATSPPAPPSGGSTVSP